MSDCVQRAAGAAHRVDHDIDRPFPRQVADRGEPFDPERPRLTLPPTPFALMADDLQLGYLVGSVV